MTRTMLHDRLPFILGAILLGASSCLAHAQISAKHDDGAQPQIDAAAAKAWSRHGFSDAQREAIREAMRRGLEEKFVPGGALLVIHRGEPVFREGFGLADIESKRPFTPDAPCRIASLTKLHTATLIAMLVEQGKLSWEDRVDKHLPDFAHLAVRGKGPASRAPKIRELLSHTAGFAGQKAYQSGEWRIKRDGTLAEAVGSLPAEGLATEPGSVFAYTGAGYLVAGRIAEVVSGKEFAALMKEMLLMPVGATLATFQLSAEIEKRMPTMYQHRNGELVKVDRSRRPEAATTFPNPGGGLISTLDDVGRVLLLHRNRGTVNEKRLIAAEPLAELYRAQPVTDRASYGLGFNVLKTGQGRGGVRLGHLGASGTQVALDFENDLIVVLLTQVPQTETQSYRQRLIQTIYAVFQSRNSARDASADD
ncbi:MAG: beta-lactamase family protein [Pirellulales bacterium]|nr:beta-lactamase family protein [Pirellulales bacterium]